MPMIDDAPARARTTEGLVAREFRAVMAAARRISDDVADDVEAILRAGLDEPMAEPDALQLLGAVVDLLEAGARAQGDDARAAAVAAGRATLVERVMQARRRVAAAARPESHGVVVLEEHDGIAPHPVLPSPVFHERAIPVREGFVRTGDIGLWDDNERLEIHVSQFERANGRKPDADEVLSIMLGQAGLPGITTDDQFKIRDLARSIAVNGVRRPPVIDVDGTLLDGNRRFAACHYLLASSEFSPEEKRRAERIVVWQLTPHATELDREAVIVASNFEPDYKQDWPEYVKARWVSDEWEAMLARERRPNKKRLLELKRRLAKNFALGPELDKVNRYLKMMEVANEFEDHHIVERSRDRYEVKHHAAEYFQYFDELGKGINPGGVNHTLNQDPVFKGLVFDLLYDGKFNSWKDIRALKHMPSNGEAMAELRRARDEPDQDEALAIVEGAVGIVNTRSAQARQTGVNTRIESFCGWFLDLPVRAFDPGAPGSITPANMQRLLRSFELVREQMSRHAAADGGTGAR